MGSRLPVFWLVAALVLPQPTAALALLERETVGEQVRRAIAVVDKRCREQKRGPYLDPADPEYRRKQSDTSCDILKVPRFDLAAIKATPEGSFAYSIQLPNPLDRPQVEYRRTMSRDRYWKALCEKDAGDFVFETATGVDRVLQVRRSPTAFSSLGPYSQELGSGTYVAVYRDPELHLVAPVMRRYLFLEAPAGGNKNAVLGEFQLFYRDPALPQRGPRYGVASRIVERPTARYAYVWRGVERERARELGIVGSELIVFDLQRSKVMAVRRDFAAYSLIPQRGSDHIVFMAPGCRSFADDGFAFIARVLEPVQQ